MANYKISYKDFPSVEFKSQKAVRAYLTSEEEAWSAMLAAQQADSVTLNVRVSSSGVLNLNQIVAAIGELRNFVGDEEGFNNRADGHKMGLALPPPSTSLEGSAILGLFGNHRSATAINVLEAFLADHRSLPISNSHQKSLRRLDQGRILLQTIGAVLSVVPNASDPQRIKVAADQAENELARVHELIDEGAASNDDRAPRLKRESMDSL